MKKLLGILLLCLLLCGCGRQTFETLLDELPVVATDPGTREVLLAFPEDAAVLTTNGTDGIYTCGSYTISLQVLPSGDVKTTIHTLSGYDADRLTVLQSDSEGVLRYDWIWTAAGEEGDVLCRAAVLDDGNYHYSLCVSADATLAGDLAEQWNDLFRSFQLATAGENQ